MGDGKLSEAELRNAGIHRFADRKELWHHVIGLVEHYKELKQEYDKEKEVKLEIKNEEEKVELELEDVPNSVLNHEIEGSMDDQKINQDEPGSMRHIDVLSEDDEDDSIVIHEDASSESDEIKNNHKNVVEMKKEENK